eukprot:TRINITY_DN74171_c0_g1_i1.p1 TRINITY_DN74171_c0_g1~~TRINITY_DN74171_c0_g1_i1.p1  ORF type:complete len:1256 (-),score=138.65 TRINITY_DN74171_c0_g1_i1:102-3869(-)
MSQGKATALPAGACDVHINPTEDELREQRHRQRWTPVFWVCAKMPCAFFVVTFSSLVSFVVYSLLTIPIEVEANFDSFMKTDVPSSVLGDIYEEALQDRRASRRLEEQPVKAYDLTLLYQLPSGSSTSTLSKQKIMEIRNVEARLRALPAWHDLCQRVDEEHRGLCEPGLSLANYALAGVTVSPTAVTPSALTPDASGTALLPYEVVTKLLQKNSLGDTIFSKGVDPSTDSYTTLRSAFRFRVPCCTEGLLSRAELDAEWKAFIGNVLVPYLDDLNRGKQPEEVVVYDGTDLMEFEVLGALGGDLALAAFSMCFVLIYMKIHMDSWFLSCFGVLCSIFAVPLAYVCCAYAGMTTVSFASFIAVFLIIGFGCDTVLVYADYWKHSEAVCSSVEERFLYTYHHGGLASACSAGTTALSFYANLFSVIRALRWFGFFMGLCVTFSWVLITFVYLPLFYVNERWQKSHPRLYSLFNCQPCIRSVLQTAGKRQASAGARREQMGRWIEHLHSWRWLYLGIPTAILLACLGITAPNITISLDAPALFPPGHNRNLLTELQSNFADLETTLEYLGTPPPSEETICGMGNDAPGCSLFWCDSTTNSVKDIGPADAAFSERSAECPCFRRLVPVEGPCETDDDGGDPLVYVRMSGVNISSIGAVDLALSGWRLSMDTKPSDIELATGIKIKSQEGVWMQNWLQGSISTETSMLISMTVDSSSSRGYSGPGACGWVHQCFCGRQRCISPPAGWEETDPYTVEMKDLVEMPMASGRRVEATQVVARTSSRGVGHRRAVAATLEDKKDEYMQPVPVVSDNWRRLQDLDSSITKKYPAVRLIFGLRLDLASPLLDEFDTASAWSFEPNFDLSDPWAQRAIYTLLTTLPMALRELGTYNWLEDFRQCMEGKGDVFPALPHKFHESARYCGAEDSKYLWMRDGEVKALRVNIFVRMKKDPDVETALSYKKLWDAHIDQWNSQAPASAKGAFFVSSIWITAEENAQLIDSVKGTIVLFLCLSFVAVIVFTRSLLLALFVTIATVGVLVGLMFFVLIIMGWKLGLVEGVCLIYFIGYAVTYTLHIAHLYAGDIREERLPITKARLSEGAALRYRRVSHAMKSIGGATLGSGITTAGASVFLVFSTLSVFERLGGMCLFVTVTSVAVALIPVPALLVIAGPRHPAACSTFSGKEEESDLSPQIFDVLDIPPDVPDKIPSAIKTRGMLYHQEMHLANSPHASSYEEPVKIPVRPETAADAESVTDPITEQHLAF